MQEQLGTYFQGEKLGGLCFGLAGVVAVVIAVAIVRLAPHYKAMLYPLLIVATVELGVCGAMQLRTDSRVARLQAQMQADPAAFRGAELPRITSMLVLFKIIEGVELLAFAAGLMLCFAYSDRQAAFAVGLGLLLQASAMLACDLAAERRAHSYKDALSAFMV